MIYRMSDGGNTLGYGVVVQYLANPRYWGCGMVVLPEHRRKGVGGRILSHLRDICRENGKIPHPGCWYHNHLSKKTVEGIGCYSKTRLLNIQF
ncbi:MAG: GNAT family N-acetyltransferase [Clostridiales bacterium]|nr:GNAT family N-acetyltransferase [Clostridiales bacterium]